MEIRKRNGEMAAFDAEKIRAAMRLAFTATNVEITEQSLNSLLRAVLKRLEDECMSVLEQYLQGDKVRMKCLFECRFHILPVKQTK